MTTLILHPEGNALNNPSLLSIMEDILERGQPLSYIGRRDNYSPFGLEGLSTRVIPKSVIRLHRIFQILGLHRTSGKILWLSNFLWIRKQRVSLVLSVDREGNLMADALEQTRGVARVYLSYEILFEAETSKQFKRPEKRIADNAALAIVQDKVRGECLVREHFLAENRIRFLPLGQTGPPKPAMFRVRDEVNIPREKRVALFLGSAEAWTGFPQVLGTLDSWPENWVLLVNARNKIRPEKLKISRQALSRVFFSSSRFPRVDDMAELFAGVDLGVALYFPQPNNKHLGENIRNIGMASGKVATLLRHNIPLVTNVEGPIGKAAASGQIGYRIDAVSSIPEILTQHRCGSFGSRCVEFYLKELDYNVHGKALVGEILQLRQPVKAKDI